MFAVKHKVLTTTLCLTQFIITPPLSRNPKILRSLENKKCTDTCLHRFRSHQPHLYQITYLDFKKKGYFFEVFSKITETFFNHIRWVCPQTNRIYRFIANGIIIFSTTRRDASQRAVLHAVGLKAENPGAWAEPQFNLALKLTDSLCHSRESGKREPHYCRVSGFLLPAFAGTSFTGMTSSVMLLSKQHLRYSLAQNRSV